MDLRQLADGRKLRIACPCIGIDGAGRALQEMNVPYLPVDVYETTTEVEAALVDLHGTAISAGFHIGKIHGDVTRVSLDSLSLPVHGLIAGPPCPPWAGRGLQKGDKDNRADVFLAIVAWIVFLVERGGLLFAVLENVPGILKKFNNAPAGFLVEVCEYLQHRCQAFAWEIRQLNTIDYALPQYRHRVFLIGMRRCYLPNQLLPPSLPPVGKKKLAAFLDGTLPHTPRLSLTQTMQFNLRSYELAIARAPIGVAQVAVVNLTRAENKAWGLDKICYDAVPTLETGNAYLFVLSLQDRAAPDHERAFFRWLSPKERLALQGINPSISNHFTSDRQLIAAAGNSYAVPVIVAVVGPLLKHVYARTGELPSFIPVTQDPYRDNVTQELRARLHIKKGGKPQYLKPQAPARKIWLENVRAARQGVRKRPCKHTGRGSRTACKGKFAGCGHGDAKAARPIIAQAILERYKQRTALCYHCQTLFQQRQKR